MDLEFVVRISARHIPLSTYKKIRQVIAWQVENDLELPFYNPEFRRNLHGELDPAFTHRNFPSHTSEISNSRESKFFTDLRSR